MWKAFKHGLNCLLGRHRYRPMFETKTEAFTEIPSGKIVRRDKHRYCCCHCDSFTPWMDDEQKRAFELTNPPSWSH